MDVDHPSVNVHAASLGGRRERGELHGAQIELAHRKVLRSQENQDLTLDSQLETQRVRIHHLTHLYMSVREILLPEPATPGSPHSQEEEITLLKDTSLILKHIPTHLERFALYFR